MKNGVHLFARKGFQLRAQIRRGGKSFHRCRPAFARISRRFADEQRDPVAARREKVGEFRAEPPRGKIREPAHFVQWLERRPGGDDAIHGGSIRRNGVWEKPVNQPPVARAVRGQSRGRFRNHSTSTIIRTSSAPKKTAKNRICLSCCVGFRLRRIPGATYGFREKSASGNQRMSWVSNGATASAGR